MKKLKLKCVIYVVSFGALIISTPFVIGSCKKQNTYTFNSIKSIDSFLSKHVDKIPSKNFGSVASDNPEMLEWLSINLIPQNVIHGYLHFLGSEFFNTHTSNGAKSSIIYKIDENKLEFKTNVISEDDGLHNGLWIQITKNNNIWKMTDSDVGTETKTFYNACFGTGYYGTQYNYIDCEDSEFPLTDAESINLTLPVASL